MHVIVYLLVIAALALTGGEIAGAQPATAVEVSSIQAKDIPPSLRLVGTVRADKSAVVAAEVSGVIARFVVEEGQYLKPGDVICEVDATVAQLRVDEAQARLAGLKARLEELENGERPEDLRRLEARVAEAEALHEKWEYEKRFVEELSNRGQSSDKERHDTEMEYQAAARRLAQERAAYEKAENGERPEVIARAREDVAAQAAVVQRLQRDLDKTRIRAPFTGAVIAKHTEVGEWIDEGGDVCEMVALEMVRVRVDVPERAIAFARPGEPATIEVEALGVSQEATISRVIPQAVAAARTFPVEVDIANEKHTLLPGMFVWTYVPAGPTGERLMVSKDAVVARGTSKTIYVVRENADGSQMAMPTPVNTGLEVGGLVEVQHPSLKGGDLVVTRGNERLFGPTAVTVRMDAAEVEVAPEPGETAARR